MGANGIQFDKELRDEVKRVQRKFIVFRADLVGDMLSVAEAKTPEKTGKTKKSWGASSGKTGVDFPQFGGSLKARAALLKTKVGTRVFAGNSHFISGFLENGTKRGTRARHMLKIGIESVKGNRA